MAERFFDNLAKSATKVGRRTLVRVTLGSLGALLLSKVRPTKAQTVPSESPLLLEKPAWKETAGQTDETKYLIEQFPGVVQPGMCLEVREGWDNIERRSRHLFGPCEQPAINPTTQTTCPPAEAPRPRCLNKNEIAAILGLPVSRIQDADYTNGETGCQDGYQLVEDGRAVFVDIAGDPGTMEGTREDGVSFVLRNGGVKAVGFTYHWEQPDVYELRRQQAQRKGVSESTIVVLGN